MIKSRYGFGIAFHTNAILDVYMRGPSSCLTMAAGAYLSHVHPLRAIPDQLDLAVAYATEGSGVVARVLIWPEKKIMHAIYKSKYGKGAAVALTAWLQGQGYHHNWGKAWFGARLLRMPQGAHFVCPGLDPPRHFVWDDGQYLRFGFPLTQEQMQTCQGIFEMSHADGLAYPMN